MGTLWEDLRLAFRTIRKSPGFAVVALLTLALGIGANTAIFHLIDSTLLRSLPVREPERLVSVSAQGGNGGMGISWGGPDLLTYPMWEQIRDHQESLSSAFAWERWDFRVGQGTKSRPVSGMWVSGDAFATLGTIPAKGRLVNREDDTRGCGTPAVVLSHAYWQSEYGGSDTAIGSKLIVDGRAFEIVGVLPPEFTGLEVGRTISIVMPFCSAAMPGAEKSKLTQRDLYWLRVMGRLKPGVTVEQASGEMAAKSAGYMEATVPDGYSARALDGYRKIRLGAFPAGSGVSDLREMYAGALWLLLGITGLVLLIACANIASLLLARASAREREMAVRLALGASTWRLVRQLLAESLLIGAAGAAAGVWVARVCSAGLLTLIRVGDESQYLDLRLDWRVLAFVTGMTLLTTALFGLSPAIRAGRVAPGDALKSGTRGSTAGRGRYGFQRALVVGQISFSLVLLVGALLFVRSFRNLIEVDPGFRTDGLVVMTFDLSKEQVPKDRLESAQKEMLEQVRSIPQVESAALTTHSPFNGSWTSAIHVDAVEGTSKFTWASPGYLRTLGIGLVAGRDVQDTDTERSAKVVVVSESFVKKFLPGQNPLGRTVRSEAEPGYPEAVYEIVGVVRDTKYQNLREATPPAEAYAPASQFPDRGPFGMIVARSSAPAGGVIAAARERIGAAHPEAELDFLIVQKMVEAMVSRERVLAMLSGAFGVIAVLLAMIGLYGVISYVVTLRRSEMGIRMALGATRGNILAIVLRQIAVLVATGIALGTLLTMGVARGAAALLYGVKPGDTMTLLAGSALLAGVALLAGYIPARRASRVDPQIALRYE